MPAVKSSKRFFLRFFLFFTIVSTLWLTADHLGLLSYFEYLTVDWRFKQRGEIDAPVKVIYVDLDSEALELMGERPLPRSYFAYTTEALFKYGKAKVIGIDNVFSSIAHSVLVDENKIKEDNDIFKNVIQSSPNLVLAVAYTEREDIVSNSSEKKLTEFPYISKGFTNPEKNGLPEMPEITLIGTEFSNLGLINTADYFSPGSTVRWVPLFAHTPGPTFLALSLEVTRIYKNLPKEAMTFSDNAISLKDAQGKVALNIPLTQKQLLEINWFSHWISPKNPRFSMKLVLAAKSWLESGTEEQKKSATEFFKAFEDAIILIGPVDPLLHDLAPTPFDNFAVPRVGVHGNLIKTFFSERFLHTPNCAIAIAFTLIFTFFVALLASYPAHLAGLLKFLSIILLGSYVVFTFFVFSHFDWILPLITPIGSAISTSFAMILIQLRETERQKSKIKGMFGSYVSPQLVNQMVEHEEDPKLGGSEEVISALFSDIESFTNICEDLTPTALITLINEYLSEMTSVIQEEKGTLDKYIGDAIVSMFGAPVKIENHAIAACRAACKMLHKQEELTKKWAKDNKWSDRILHMHTRVGVNSGIATIGNMGSSIRFNYTMLGDNVNLASRCESAGKTYGVYGLVTENTYNFAKTSDVVFRHIDRIIVKGKSTPVSMYEIVGFKNDITSQTSDCLQFFEKGFNAYLSRDWDRAIESFNQSFSLERFPADGHHTNPSKLFIDRCQHMKTIKLDENWDGVFVMKTK